MTKDEALRMAIVELMNVVESCNNGQVHFDGDDFHETLEACRKALEQPTNMVTIPLDKLEDMQRRLKEQPKNTQPLDEVIEEFMKDPAMKQAMDKAREKLSPLFSHPTPQTTQEHSMTYEDGFTHGYDAHLADYKEQPTQVPIFKEGMRVVAKNTAGFHAGAHGVIKTIELRIWVLRDGASSLVYYDTSELEMEEAK